MKAGWKAGTFIFNNENFTQDNFKNLLKYGSVPGYIFADRNFQPLLNLDLGSNGSYIFKDELLKIYNSRPTESLDTKVAELGRQLGVANRLSQKKYDSSYFAEIFQKLNNRIQGQGAIVGQVPQGAVVINFTPLPPPALAPAPAPLPPLTPPTLTPNLAIVPYMSFQNAQIMAIKMCMNSSTFPKCITDDPSEFPAYQRAIFDLTGIQPDNYRDVELFGVFYIETKEGMDDPNATFLKTIKAIIKVNLYAYTKLQELLNSGRLREDAFSRAQQEKIVQFLELFQPALAKGNEIV